MDRNFGKILLEVKKIPVKTKPAGTGMAMAHVVKLSLWRYFVEVPMSSVYTCIDF